jgi:hypothetical protein
VSCEPIVQQGAVRQAGEPIVQGQTPEPSVRRVRLRLPGSNAKAGISDNHKENNCSEEQLQSYQLPVRGDI